MSPPLLYSNKSDHQNQKRIYLEDNLILHTLIESTERMGMEIPSFKTQISQRPVFTERLNTLREQSVRPYDRKLGGHRNVN